MINCAIVGLGRWGRSLVEAARSCPRLKITRAVETDLERARDFCSERDIALTGELRGGPRRSRDRRGAAGDAAFAASRRR